MAPVPYYQRHIFFCLNDRENGERSCAHNGAREGFDHCKSRMKKENLLGPGKVRDYYRVEDETGERFWIFRAGLYGDGDKAPKWWLHGLFG